MDRELQRALKQAYETPKSKEKEQFIKNLGFPKTDRRDFIIGQVAYIQKSVWIVSVLLFLVVVYFCFSSGKNFRTDSFLWEISSVLPFLALFSVTELFRSQRYCMSELEAGCRFGLPQVMLAKMFILGVWNSAVLAAVILLLGSCLPDGIGIIALYLLTPFLLVCGVSLFILNRIRSRNSLYICAAVTAGINLLNMIVQKSLLAAGGRSGRFIMLFLLFAGILMTGIQIKGMFQKMEEEQWSFV